MVDLLETKGDASPPDGDTKIGNGELILISIII